jgi:DNA-binding winged helix-turn-helix (wHTH) protein
MGRAGAIEVGELRIDVERAEVRARGRRIDVQPRIVELLGLLARSSPRVLSRRELLETLWPATVVTDHSLTVCVAEARRLLRDATGRPWIETVPRRGYRLSEPALHPATAGAPDAPLPLVAVLGIENLTHNPTLDPLCDALTEEIATALALHVAPGLQARLALGVVTRRPLALRCEREASGLARELGAGYALSGSLRAAPGALDLALHLIDARDGVHI